MARKKEGAEITKFLNIVKRVCDRKNLNHKQATQLVWEVMEEVAIELVNEKSVFIKGFGSIIPYYVQPRCKTFSFVNSRGELIEGERKPFLKFKLSLNNKIDPTKNYQKTR